MKTKEVIDTASLLSKSAVLVVFLCVGGITALILDKVLRAHKLAEKFTGKYLEPAIDALEKLWGFDELDDQW